MRQQVRRWLHLPFPTPWHRAGLALCLACLHKPEDRPAPLPNRHQDTHQFIQWFWGRVLALAFSFLGPRTRLSVVSCFLILRKCSPPGEAHSNSCAHNRCCCGTTGPSHSKECAWSRERLRGGLCHCCRTRAKFLLVPSCPRQGLLNISHALRATGGERQDSGSGSDPPGSEKRDLRLGPGGGAGHAGEVGL